MKKVCSKNAIIAVLIATVGVMGFYIFAMENRLGRAGQTLPVTKAHLPRGQVQEAMVKQTEFQMCYEEYLARHPAADEGSITVHWMIDEEGHLDVLKLIGSDFQDESLSNCVLDKIRNTPFPAFSRRAGQLVAQRIHFQRKGDRLDFQ
jgi:hypothetical protein